MEDELKKIWQSSANEEHIKFEKARLIIDAKTSLEHVHQVIERGDSKKTIIAMIVIPLFIYYAFTIPFIVSKIASILAVVWGIYVLFIIVKVKRKKPSTLTENYLEYLYKTKEYLTSQKNVRDTVLYWYIIPAMLLSFLFLSSYIGIPEKTFRFFFQISATIFLGIFSYLFHKEVIEKEISPRLEKIDELIKVLEEEQ